MSDQDWFGCPSRCWRRVEVKEEAVHLDVAYDREHFFLRQSL
jgi:hypothetical protein